MYEAAGDLFGTKGLEYVLVIGYLILLVLCWRFVRPRSERGEGPGDEVPPDAGLRRDCHYHPAHTWVRPNGDGVVRVGMDHLAGALLGVVDGLELPEPGDDLTAGEHGWYLRLDGERVPVVAPVDGVVTARNEAVYREPELLRRAPYDDGWLVDVRVPNRAASLRNLLVGAGAQAWARSAAEELRRLAENGSQKPGSAAETGQEGDREIAPAARARLARELLRTGDPHGDGAVSTAADPEVEAQLHGS